LVARLFTCDGDPNRFERKALTDPNMHYVGVSYGDHNSQFKKMLCINLSELTRPIGKSEPDAPVESYNPFGPKSASEDLPDKITGRLPYNTSTPNNYLSAGAPVGTQSQPPAVMGARNILGELDKINDAVDSASAPALTKAARNIMGEIEKLKGYPAPSGDPNARKALDDSIERLKKALGDLLGATKQNMHNPSPANRDRVNKAVDNLKRALKNTVNLSTDPEAYKNYRSFDDINTTLIGSGMLQAAANAAQNLTAAFQIDD